MATIRIQLRRGLSSDWTSVNPILASGEMGIESNTNLFKFGNGTDHWNDLDYANNSDVVIGEIAQDAIDAALSMGSGLTKSYNDGTNTITISLDSSVTKNSSSQTLTNKTISGNSNTVTVKNDTSANWATNNPVLNTGELGIETDTFKIKLGDGSNWNSITTYVNVVPSDLNTTLGDYVLVSDIGSQGGVVGLNNSKNAIIPGTAVIFEGATDDSYETTIEATDPTADRVITIPDATGTIALTSSPTFTGTVTTNNLTVNGDLTVSGTTTTVNSTEINIGNTFKFEGSTPDSYETILEATDPTADRTISLPDASGTIALTAQLNNYLTTSTRGSALGVASLDGAGQIILSELPPDVALNNDVSTAQTNAQNYADTAISTHNSDTTSVHGITDTNALATKTGTETITNKTINLSSNTLSGTISEFNTALSDGDFATLAGASTLTNKAIDLTDNTITGTISEFNTALSDGNFATLDGTESFTNKTISYSNNTISVQVSNVSDLTASASELNTLDGITASTAELNILDGITSSTAELNILDGVTADYTEINVLDGITASTAELNILDGVTSSASELNILDGATLSVTELNYVDGVTSSIQTQLDGKANLSGATFTGAVAVSNTTQSTSTTTGAIKTAGGLGVEKNAYVGGNLVISGNFTVNGTTTTVNTTNFTTADPVIYLGEGNNANSVDLGFVASYNDGTYAHQGLVKDASDSKWKLFKGVTDEPTTTINFAQGSLDTLAVAALETSSLTVGSVSNTEIGYLDGVTSAIQTQLNDKAPLASPTFTGTVTLPNDTVTSAMILDGTIVNADISASAAIAYSKLNLSGSITSSDIVDGTIVNADINASAAIAQSKISNLTTDLAAKTPELYTFTTDSTTARTLATADAYKSLKFTSASAITVTVPTDANDNIPVGTYIELYQYGAGQITVSHTGVTVNSADSNKKTRVQYSAITLVKMAANEWLLVGDTAA